MTRTDVHRPAALVTEDYEFFGCGAFGTADEPGYSPLISPRGQELLNDGWRFADVESAGCQHCGAHLRYFAILLHTPSKTFVQVGEQCLDNRFSLATKEFQKLRKEASLNRDRIAKTEKRARFLSDPRNAAAVRYAKEAGDAASAAFEKRMGYPPSPEFDDFFGFFYCDIHNKFERYGDLSPAQVDAVLRGKDRDAKREAERAAAQATASPVLEGRVKITGEVLGLKSVPGYQGQPTRKMRVRDERGFTVYGTVPSALSSVPDAEGVRPLAKGDRVTFVATVKASNDDATFGFYSRPTNAVPA